MKIKINIAQLLSIGILLNNFSFYSNASISNTEISNRYETLEGEYITIDDSIEGELVEIEVFGNTVQDENDLSDIQSVGDLYVDENGNPILDSQGREQYKVDIISSNYNSNNLIFEELNVVANTVIDINLDRNTSHTIEFIISDILSEGQIITDGDYYGLSIWKEGNSITIKNFNTDAGMHSCSLDVTTDDIISIIYDGVYKIYKNGLKISDVGWRFANTNQIKIVQPLNFFKINNIDIRKDECMISFPVKNKTTILLPSQLQKVGNVADRLYWDNEKGRYIVEKNIASINVGNYPDFRKFVENNVDIFNMRNLPNSITIGEGWDIKVLANKFKATGKLGANFSIASVYGDAYNGFNDVSFTIGDLDITTIEEFKEYCLNNNIYLYYPIISQLIETNIASKLKIPTYDGKTHIYVEGKNGISPTLKVTVDRLPQIAKNSVEKAEINSIMDNISLARMYVNMLPESLYKDQLQEQLSNVFSSDITLERKISSANMDIYIKSENMLSMTLSTSNITFEDYSGVSDLEQTNAIEISINSSLPYQLNSYLESEIKNADGSNKIDIDRLGIKDSSETTYKEFITTSSKLILKDNCNAGNGLIHNIDLMLKGGDAYPSDTYKTVVKFEAEQK